MSAEQLLHLLRINLKKRYWPAQCVLIKLGVVEGISDESIEFALALITVLNLTLTWKWSSS